MERTDRTNNLIVIPLEPRYLVCDMEAFYAHVASFTNSGNQRVKRQIVLEMTEMIVKLWTKGISLDPRNPIATITRFLRTVSRSSNQYFRFSRDVDSA